MRPTTGTMLQQNNNNNYPCLNVSGSTREMLQKCSRASLPFPSRLELGLGDLPLIRGLRAWALCSKNRHKAGGLLGGGQAPTAPPAGRGTSCPRPADVYLSGEWGRMGYGIPLGLDARQAGIGALVTVATLKTSEGSGKTQTQCLFLRTEKGSCLYSTAKPGSGGTTGVVGGWLRGKTGGGGGGRDNGPPAQTGANRVRVRSGRRWRKSGNAEKTGWSRERQQRSWEDPAEERQEERDKGGPDSKQQDCRGGRCCHDASPKACSQCGPRAQRRESQDGPDGGESLTNGQGMRKELQKNDEEEKGGLCKSSNCVVAESKPDLESNRTDSHCHVGGAESDEGLKTSRSKDDYSERDEDTNPDVMKLHTGSSDFIHGRSEPETEGFKSRRINERKPAEESCEVAAADADGFSDQETEKEQNIIQVPAEFLAFPASITTTNQSSVPIGGTTGQETCWVQTENKQQVEEADVGFDEKNTVNEKLNKNAQIRSKQEDEDVLSSPLRHKDPSISETDRRIVMENINGRSELDGFKSRLIKDGKPGEESCKEAAGDADGFPYQETEKKEDIFQVPAEFLAFPASITTTNQSTVPIGDTAGQETCWVQTENNPQVEENTVNENKNMPPQISVLSSPFRLGDPSIQETDGRVVSENSRTEESEEENLEERGGEDEDCRRENTCEKVEDATQEDNKRERAAEEDEESTSVEPNGETSTDVAGSPTSSAPSLANPAPSLPLLGSMATGLEEEVVKTTTGDGEAKPKERASTVATEEDAEEEEDEFGVFVQAEGESAWTEGFTTPASVPCGSREIAALGNQAIAGELSHWTAGWMDSSFHQSDDTWTAFPQDSSDEGRDIVDQWWPTSAVEERRDQLSTNQNLVEVFAEAFPSLPGPSCSDLAAVPTLTQLLRGRTSQDQGLLDSFHDLNKMIGQRYKRANGVSRDLLLKTLHLEQPQTEVRPASWTANRRLSPGLPSANQHAQSAAAKRRLSYDYNRNVME
ncbi:retinitis pigmentosa 1-like 1 protein [Amphiprion ocellaris]|uniref:retinitis pigmentosa 1-like 1 protein n=1 Tax=Amphiprion ocellaris TaxID=80972 RepID=UPI002410CE23|nr:retinitis pigmentosa 1-like 1 protein [Amphiprion ocellaris]